MEIVALSDTHGMHDLAIPSGDVLVHAGDVSMLGKSEEIQSFLGWFASLPHPRKLFIAGNHDFLLEKDTSILDGFPTIEYLMDEEIIIDGIKFYGSPWTPKFGEWAFMRPDDELERAWNYIPADVDVLITHGPPYSILDRTVFYGNISVGSKSLLNRVLTIRPKYHIFGHIHEGYGGKSRKATTFYNVSVMDEQYQQRNSPIVFSVNGLVSRNTGG